MIHFFGAFPGDRITAEVSPSKGTFLKFLLVTKR